LNILVAPTTDVLLKATHFLHTVTPIKSLYSAKLQKVQAVLPFTKENVPLSHTTQLVLFLSNVPAAHISQALAPKKLVCDPALQDTQTVLALTAENFPISHATQLFLSTS
jgi:hypothetical protein